MERVAKIFIPQQATQQASSPAATGNFLLNSIPYQLPAGVFPLVTGYVARFQYLNVGLSQSSPYTAAGQLISTVINLQGPTPGAAVTWPAFPLSVSALFVAGGYSQAVFPVIPAPQWSWDDFLTTWITNPNFLQAQTVVNVTTAGGALLIWFSGVLEVWKP